MNIKRLGMRTLAGASMLLIGMAVLPFAMRAHSRSVSKAAGSARLSSTMSLQAGLRKIRYFERLALQPAASLMGRQLGPRFVGPGREVTQATGTLAIGSDHHAIAIVRSRDDDGERLAMGLDGGPLSYTWSAKDGAQAQGKIPSPADRSFIERVTFDSPDQFVLAQLRGASYFTVGRGVRPPEAASLETYNGPTWDVIQVNEPPGLATKPESPGRLYYINNATGLLDKTLASDQLGKIQTSFSNWINQSGDMIPARVTWSRSGQVIMELSLAQVTSSPRN